MGLIKYAYNGNIIKAREALRKGTDVNSTVEHGLTALMWATSKNHKDMVKLLIEHGANINAKDDFGWTALMKAAWEDYIDIVKLLLNHSADINTNNKDGKTAIDLAKGQSKKYLERIFNQEKD